MDTLLTESMVSLFLFFKLLASSGKLLQGLRGIPPRRCAAGVNRISRQRRISGVPGIEDSGGDITEMRGVSSGNCCLPRSHDPSDHGIAQVDGAALGLTQRHQSG